MNRNCTLKLHVMSASITHERMLISILVKLVQGYWSEVE